MKPPADSLRRYLPILEWGAAYRTETLINDLVAALIVTIMLIPQSLAYAMLAGLPPQIGLYASMAPLVIYAVFGTSRTLAVGPVAILSLMTAAAAGKVAAAGAPQYLEAALILAIMSGGLLVLFGLLRMGFLANFLSHPVISGFITASGVLIATSQVKHILGVEADGHSMPEIVTSVMGALHQISIPTIGIGLASLAFLFWSRTRLRPLLERCGLNQRSAAIVARAGPVFAVAASIGAVSLLGLHERGVRILGAIPQTLPSFTTPSFSPDLWSQLAGSAALIALIGFVESVSVAKTLAAKRRQRIDPNQELIGLGAASLSAGFTSGYPVTGGLARSAVNFDAGAQTPAAGAFTAVGIALAAVFLTPYLYYLPQAVLAATIIVAVLSLVDVGAIKRTWRYSRTDFASMAATIATTLLWSVEAGVMAGVALSLILHLYNTSRPHFAIVGQVPGTQHFRNVERHTVITSPHVLTLRLDESLYFANARFLEDTVYRLVGEKQELRDLVLMCPAVNHIDASGLESLEAINARLKEAGIRLHLSEVKGPVMDRLHRSHFLDELSGQVFLHQFEAMQTLDPPRSASDMPAPAVTPRG
jgi:SulP family sulfate permease